MRKRFLGVLLFFCMMTAIIMPTTAMAWEMGDFELKDGIYYDSGALKKLTASFCWNNPSAVGRLVLMSNSLRSPGETGTFEMYGDFTNYGYYADYFTTLDEAIGYDDRNGAFGIISYSETCEMVEDEAVAISISFEESLLPLNENKIYYVYLWTQYKGQIYPDALICAIKVQDGEVRYAAATGQNTYDSSAFEAVESQTKYSVKVNSAEHMTKKSDSGEEIQNNLTAAMTPVVYTADTGYYFPENYSVATVNGIMVTRDSQSQITVYGTPSANAEITLTAPTVEPEPEPTPEPDPSGFDFTSLRTLKTKSITVNHQTKTIDIEAADGADYITILVHQKEVIPGGTFKMASYMGNKVVYNSGGSYRIYLVSNFNVSVKANITVDGVTEQYTVNVQFDASNASFDFTSLRGENFDDVVVNHNDKTIEITANDTAENIMLYVSQHNAVYGGKLRMASYMGNRVVYNSNGVYTIYANGKKAVTVKVNITINDTVEQYLVTINFPGVVWNFDDVEGDNIQNVVIDHTNKEITIDASSGCNNILLYIDQNCPLSVKGQIWMKSYMGNDVVYNSSDRTYTITKEDENSITVKTKITMLGETRYYDMIINFAENN